MHPWSVVAEHLLAPLDILHVGERNLLWGWLVSGLNAAFRPGFPFWSERMTGLPPLLLMCLAAALPALWRGPATPQLVWLRSLSLAVLLTWALALRFGETTGWYLVWSLVPGAKAARTVARYQIFLVVPVVGLALAGLAARRLPRPALAALATLLLAEQLNLYSPRFLDRPLELARLRAMPAPPAACQAFYVTAGRAESRFGEATETTYNHNTEAMLVAEYLRLPTINGISSFNPPGWPDRWPGQPDYLPGIRAYAARYNVIGLCGLDLRRMAWDATPLR
jgi:hypothetical protein